MVYHEVRQMLSEELSSFDISLCTGNNPLSYVYKILFNFFSVAGSAIEGWAPAAYLENLHRKTSRTSSRSQDRLNDH